MKRSTNSKIEECKFEQESNQDDKIIYPSSLVLIGLSGCGKSSLLETLSRPQFLKYFKSPISNNTKEWEFTLTFDGIEKDQSKDFKIYIKDFETRNKKYTVFDVPHRDNIQAETVIGTVMADVTALVISAKEGEFEDGFKSQGQTKALIKAVRNLGVDNLIVIINKMDDETVNWSQARYSHIVNSITPFLLDSGFKVENLVFIPISGKTGANIKQLSGICSWYKGLPLSEILDGIEPRKLSSVGPLKIIVLDQVKDKEDVIFGKVEGGVVKVGNKVFLTQKKLKYEIIEIYDYKQSKVEFGNPGEYIGIKVKLIVEKSFIHKGDVLCSVDDDCPIVNLFEAEISILKHHPLKPVITEGYEGVLQSEEFSHKVFINSLDKIYEFDRDGNKVGEKRPLYSSSGSKVVATFCSKDPISDEDDQFIKKLKDFNLRDDEKIIGLGKVITTNSLKD